MFRRTNETNDKIFVRQFQNKKISQTAIITEPITGKQ